MALSVVVAFSVMLMTTWNIIISLYAIISIAGTIFVTVGSLVLLGWELNVLESVTISVAVGLSVDFAVHYGVAYRLAPEPDREGKVVFSLSRMGSAIAMAALTTFVAGAMMMPSTVLAYTQLGTFLMLIMCVSWAFATFFFQCMCRCLGPQGTCGQIPLPKKLQCYTFSENTSENQSNLSQGKLGACYTSKYQIDNARSEGRHEHYELEPLALNVRNEEKASDEEQGACTPLHNGITSHHSTLKSCTDPGEPSPEIEHGLPGTELSHLHQYMHSTRCTCENSMHQYTRERQRTPYHPCSNQCPAKQTNHLPVGQNLQSSRDTTHTPTDCFVNCGHFQHCSQSQTSRPTPHRCFPGGYSMQAVHLLHQALLSDTAVHDESHINACGPNSPLPESQSFPAHIRFPDVQCCALPDTTRVCTVNHDTQKTGDLALNSQTPQKISWNHIKTKANGTCVLLQDSREIRETIPVVPEESVKCNLSNKDNNERQSQYLPKNLTVLKRL